MPVIYLKHPIHGNKIAICDEEAVADEENGWERYSLASLVSRSKEIERVEISGDEIDQADKEELKKRWEEKFGKPPHHRKSLETLRAEVEAA